MNERHRLRLEYMNVQGITIAKLEKLSNRILKNQTDIIIIAEHWFACQNQMESNPFFLRSTPKNKIERTTGHQNGGVCLLVNPNVIEKRTFC